MKYSFLPLTLLCSNATQLGHSLPNCASNGDTGIQSFWTSSLLCQLNHINIALILVSE